MRKRRSARRPWSRTRLQLNVFLAGLLVVAVLAVGVGGAAAATTDVYCPPTGTDSLQAAINAAGTGDTIRIHGTCVGNFDVPGASAATSLTLQGATSGAGLDGNQTGRTLLVHNGVSLTIQALRIVNGKASGRGGGIEMTSSGTKVKLVNSTVSGNTADGNDGGGIDLSSGSETLTLIGSTVSGNTTLHNDGGGINVNGSDTVTITDSTLSGNTTAPSGDHDGGGIDLANNGAVLTMTGSTVSGNTSGGNGEGGGIDCESCSSITLTNTTVSKNTDAGGDGGGGVGIETSAAITLSVDGSTVANNIAKTGDGGGIYISSSNPSATVTSSWISGNRAPNGNGGGIYDAGTVSIGQTTIGARAHFLNDGNQAMNGGGIYIKDSSASVSLQSSSTVADNAASVDGGGVWNASGGTLLIGSGSIVFHNSPDNVS